MPATATVQPLKTAKSSPPDRGMAELTSVLKLLSDPARLVMLRELAKGEVHVSDLCQRLDLPQPLISHHLALLRVSGIVEDRRQAKRVYYRLGTAHRGLVSSVLWRLG